MEETCSIFVMLNTNIVCVGFTRIRHKFIALFGGCRDEHVQNNRTAESLHLVADRVHRASGAECLGGGESARHHRPS